ncbi:MAG: flagellar export chaperone FliS [Candidatus Acidiferrales bacterium]
MRDPARAYRELAVGGASPVGLIVILYEEVNRCLRRALDAVRRNHIERRTRELSHAIVVIGHLQSVLDFEKGGQVARSLSNFYNLSRVKILECSGPNAAQILEGLAAEFTGLAEGWQQIDCELSKQQEPEPAMVGPVPPPVLRGIESRRVRASR